MISPETTVSDVVVARPGTARVLEGLGLDYCCGGGRPLAEACRARGLDVDAVVSQLTAVEDDGGACDVADLGDAELCEHIVSVHHARLREELPRVSALIEKVVRAHGDEDPRLPFVGAAFEELRAELDRHMADEETVLFPAVVAGDHPAVEGFVDDHADAGRLLERLSELTDGYDLAGARCNTHRATLHTLAELQADLHRHIHEENNVLFPRLA